LYTGLRGKIRKRQMASTIKARYLQKMQPTRSGVFNIPYHEIQLNLEIKYFLMEYSFLAKIIEKPKLIKR
jgi:hypothetical protein